MKARQNLILGLCLGAAALGFLFVVHGYVKTWRLWNIPAANLPFMDFRVITAGADAHRQGLDPMVSNATDPSGRPLNYPRIWQGLYALGIGQEQTVLLGVISILLFAAGVCVFIPRPSNTDVAFILAAIFSPAVLLCVERGNTDLIVFFLLALAVASAERSAVASVALVLVGFVLKLFPLLGLTVVLGKPRRVVITAAVVAAGVMGFYVWLTYDDLLRINALTGHDTWLSYGMNILWMKLVAEKVSDGLAIQILSRCAVFAAILWGIAGWWRGAGWGAGREGPGLSAFRVGAACYVGTFILENNFDYRLVFLIFAIPQLLAWAGGAQGGLTRVARLALTAIYVSLWSMVIDRLVTALPGGAWLSFLVSEAAKWTVFGTLLYLFAVSAPEWLATARRADHPGPATAGGEPAQSV
ncbi:MAG TPA: hypothetical protein VLT83_00595 [Opitutaceae bacterium]|nr:hypothetical protein [Opitutaceae bacterium]